MKKLLLLAVPTVLSFGLMAQNVGIGTNNPQQKLDVSGDINSSTGYRIGSAATIGNYLRGNGSKFVSSAIQAGDLPDLSATYIKNQISSDQAAGFRINGNGIFNGGSVGIGTTSPSFKLQVVGGAIATDNYFYNSTIGIGQVVLNSSGAYYGNIANPAAQVWSLGYSSGGTAIGTPVLAWTSGGWVGIGTTAPSTNLDVNGTVRVRGGGPSAGEVLTATDANGNATWQQTESFTSADAQTGGTGWKRIAHIDGAAGRGYGKITVYTTGGSYTPEMTTIDWFHDWSTSAGLKISKQSPGAYWSDVRITDDGGTNSYIEVNFTSDVTQLSLLSDNYGYQKATLYSGALPAGSGNVRATATVGRFNVGEDDFYVDDNGNVGIGTSSPLTNLHVSGTVTPGITISSSNYPTTYKAQLGVQGDGQGVLILGNNNVNEIRFGNSGTGGYGNIYVNNTADYSSAANGILAATFASNGNVGIGTSSPLTNLHVSGTVASALTVSSSNYPTTYKTQLGVQGTAEGVLILGNNGVNEIRFGNSGAGGSGNIYVNNTADYSSASTGTLAATFASNGNVGIGTASPGQKLSVAGTIESTSGGVKFPDATLQTSAAVWKKVYQTTLTTASQTIDITGLNLDGSSVYEIYFTTTSNATGEVRMYFNGNYTDASYRAQHFHAYGGSLGEALRNYPEVGTLTAGEGRYIKLSIMRGPDGYARYLAHETGNITTSYGEHLYGGIYPTSTNITSIRLKNTGGNFSIGTKVIILGMQY